MIKISEARVMKELKLASFDGKLIHCYLWDDVSAPKAVLQLSHGMSEYGGRYDAFARYMNAHGYIVFADDHRAHGRTESDEMRGHSEGDIFDNTLKDLVFFHEYLKSYGLPQVFLGHSYGSFLGQAFLQEKTDVRAVALLGTAYMGGFASVLASIAIAPIFLICGSCRPAFVAKTGDYIFGKKYPGEKGASLWLSQNPASRQAFIDDPLCGVNMSIAFDYYLFKNLGKRYSKKALLRLNKNTPIGIFSGSMDPIGGNNSAKAKKLYLTYIYQGIKAEMHCYDNDRHELLFELNYEQVYADILAFFDKNLTK